MNLAIVTGAGTGIGRATALRMAARGLHVACIGRTATTLAAVRDAIVAAGGAAEVLVADCGAPADIARVLAAMRGRPVAALVHAAGRDIARSFADTRADDLDAMLATNVRGPFLLTQGLLGQFTAGAGVVFVGSVSARRGRDRHAGYGASKAALIGLTVNLAAELGPAVRVNCVSPGATRTGMLKAFISDTTRGLSEREQADLRVSDAARMLLDRVADPDEVAASIVHLALDATAVTGIDLAVDVGYTAS